MKARKLGKGRRSAGGQESRDGSKLLTISCPSRNRVAASERPNVFTSGRYESKSLAQEARRVTVGIS